MLVFVKKLAAILFVAGIAFVQNGVRGETWGNIYTTSLIDNVRIYKYGIPFMVREETIKFPSVSLSSDILFYFFHLKWKMCVQIVKIRGFFFSIH